MANSKHIIVCFANQSSKCVNGSQDIVKAWLVITWFENVAIINFVKILMVMNQQFITIGHAGKLTFDTIC